MKLLSSLAVLALLQGTTFAQQPPTLKGITVIANVSLSGDVFTYSYTISNPSISSGSVSVVALDVSQQANGASVSDQGLTAGLGFLASTDQAVTQATQTIPTIPTTGAAPVDWMCSRAADGHFVWAASDDAGLIPPGATISGLTLMSHGLPGFRTVVIEPFFELSDLPISFPVSAADIQRYDRQRAALEATMIFTTGSIGPVALPLNFSASNFLQTIINYKEQAIQLGWIKDQGIGISLDAKLNAASASLARGDNKTAVNQLNALLNEVNAQAGKQLSPETVALLTFNTQYLIGKIQ